MACNHTLGELKNPLIGANPVTISLENRLGVIGSLVGPEHLYFTSNLTMHKSCMICGQDLDDIWKGIYGDAGIVRTRHVSKETSDGGCIL